MVYINSPLRQPPHAAPTTPNALHRRAAATPTAATTFTPSTTATSPPEDTGAADFRALFSPKPAAAAPQAAPAPMSNPASTSVTSSSVTTQTPASPPTAQSVFGDNPWITNPGGRAPNGITYNYNPIYFATPATAAKVAQMIGGTVVATNAITPFGPFQQNQPNQMVQLPSGRMLNAGIIADFYNHGYSQPYINMMISNEVNDTAT
jgi:hypothetical protein